MTENMQLYLDYVSDVYTHGLTHQISRFVAFRHIEHQKGIYPPTIDGLSGWIRQLRTAFSDFKAAVSETAEVEDRIWARVIMEGTHVGRYLGIEPTGKHIVADLMEECRMRDGKIVEHWGVFDRFALIQQISTGKLSMPLDGGFKDISLF